MSCKPLPGTSETCLLQFLPGAPFRFMAASDSEGLLLRMAHVMGLETIKETDAPRIVFTRCDPSCKDCVILATGSIQQPFLEQGSALWQAVELPYMRMWRNAEVPDIICQLRHWDDVISDLARIKGALNPVYLNLVRLGGFPIHGALIQYKDKGIILAGYGGTGKTTACSRLTHPFFPLSDDETVIVPEGDLFYAHPMPTWSGYQNNRPVKTTCVRQKLPLKAVFFLKQSKEDRVGPMGTGEAAVRLHQSSSETLATYRFFSKPECVVDAPKKILFETACKIAKQVPAYTLHLSLTGRFWENLAKVLDDLSGRKTP